VRTDRLRALSIDAFVEPEAIDPLYLDGRMYYLLPDGDVAAEPYALVLAAMQREDRWGIGQIVLSGKEQLALIRPLKGLLQMAMLNYDEELRPPEDFGDVRLPRPAARQLKLAQSLVRNWSTDKFDFTAYDDEYRQRVAEMIEAKVAGREIVASEEPEPPRVLDILEALKQSLGGRPQRGKRSSRRRTG
jgi:DNA end-binding protein Ku